MDCILCNKSINDSEEKMEVFTTDEEQVTVHRACYEDYLKAMSMCGSGCSNCPGCG